ncbi:hypothetical protein [Microbacterium xylanilyticum]
MVEQRPGSGETMRPVGLGAGLAIGIGVGVGLGGALHNTGTGVAVGLVLGAAVMVLSTWAGTRRDREEQRRRAEAASTAEPGVAADPSDAEPDQPSAGPRDDGA